MNKLLIAILIVLTLQVRFQQAFIVVCFQLNQDSIASKYCENKDKPELHCLGICYLKKQLEKTGDEQTSLILPYLRVDILPITSLRFMPIYLENDLPVFSDVYILAEHLSPLMEIFIPPPIS